MEQRGEKDGIEVKNHATLDLRIDTVGEEKGDAVTEERRRKGIAGKLVGERVLEKRSEELKDERNLIPNVAFVAGRKKRKTAEGGCEEKTGKITAKPVLLQILCGYN